jgi:hypothetical protein
MTIRVGTKKPGGGGVEGVAAKQTRTRDSAFILSLTQL